MSAREKLDYTLIRSRRSTVALQIKNAKVIVRAPLYMPLSQIEAFVKKHERWIKTKLSQTQADDVTVLTAKQIEELFQRARDYFPERVSYYAALMGVEYRSVTVRLQKTRWGSCSGKKNLNFNCLLMLCPQEVIDSVIVHELAHLVFMDHSKAFYDLVLRFYPQYHIHHGYLKKNSARLMKMAGF